MKCPCCGAAELIHDTRDMPFIYTGETTTIPAVTGDFFTAHSTPRQTSHSLQRPLHFTVQRKPDGLRTLPI